MSETFTLDFNDICTQALKRLGAVTFGNAPRIEDMLAAQNELNAMEKNWRADDVMLWKTKWVTVPLVASDFVLGSDGNSYECIRSHTSSTDTAPITGAQWLSYWGLRYSAWATATSYVAGQIVVGTDGDLYSCLLANVSAAGTKPITGASFATYWALYTAITPTAWVDATAYHSICNPLLDASILGTDNKIIGVGSAFLRNDQSQDSYVNSHLQAFEYFRMGNKLNQGRPTMLYYKRNPSVDEFFLYPYPDTNTWVLNIELYFYPDDMVNPTDSVDFLSEWIAPLIDGLTVRLYPLFPGRSRTTLGEHIQIFRDSYAKAKGGDSEKGEVQYVPDFWLNNGRY